MEKKRLNLTIEAASERGPGRARAATDQEGLGVRAYIAVLGFRRHQGARQNCTHCSMVMAQKLRPRTHGQAAVHRFYTPMLHPKSPRRGR